MQGNSGSRKSILCHYEHCIFMKGEIRKTNVTPGHEFASYHFPLWSGLILEVIWVTFTLREKIMVTSFEIYANLSKKMDSEYFT